jgi:hypothetical protein
MGAYIPSIGSGILSQNFSLLATDHVTVSMWLYLKDVVTTPQYRILWSGPSTANYLNLELDNGGGATSVYNSDYTTLTGPVNAHGAVINYNTWYHIAITCYSQYANSHIVRGYLNGMTDNNVNTTFTDTFLNISSISIGNLDTVTNTIGGIISDFRLWRRALSAAEIFKEYKSSVPYSRAGLYIWTPLVDDLRYDKSGCNNDWTTKSGTVTLVNDNPIHLIGYNTIDR